MCHARSVPRRRLGVALLVPPPVDREVDGLRRALGDPSLGRIPAHLTLVPPVNVAEDRLVDALVLLRQAAAATRPFTVRLGPVATFHPVNPVLYLAVDDTDGSVAAIRDRAFRPPLERRLTWPFVPHVTVADGADPDLIDGAVAALASYRASFVVERVHLLEEGEGRVWTPIADHRFEAEAVVGRGGLPLTLTVSERPDPDAAVMLLTEWQQYGVDLFGPASRSPEPFAVVARRDGEAAGVATGEMREERPGTAEAHLSRLIVRRDLRNEGIGAHLLARFLSEAADRGAHRAVLRTRAGGPAERFYLSHGWTEHSRLPDWRAGHDFVVLHRHL